MKKSGTILFLTLLFIILLSILGLLIKNKKIDTRKEEMTTNKNVNKKQEELKTTSAEEEIISKSNSFEDMQYTELDKKDWNVYKNEKYGYEIKYPKDAKIEFGPLHKNESPLIFTILINDKSVIDFYTWDPHSPLTMDSIKHHKNKEEINSNFNLPLKEYVDYVWLLNKEESEKVEDKKISKIEQVKINNFNAYQFRITKNFRDILNNYQITDNYFTYLGNKEYRYEIRSESTNLGLNIVNSFRLLK